MSTSITCPRCGMTSHNPNDVRERYCGMCNMFHDEIALAQSRSTAPALISTKTVFVAREKSRGRYAVLGHETGMGRTVESTDDLERAKRFTSTVDIMLTLGGHYRGYEAVKLTVTTTINVVGTEAFPAEDRVWGDRR